MSHIMKTLQEYLNSEYPTKEEKEEVREIEVNYDNGWEFQKIDTKELNLSEYPNLERVKIVGVYLKTKLTELEINSAKLRVLDIDYNQLTELDLSNCPNLKELDCRGNKLTKLELNSNTKLERLDIRDNNFSRLDLTFLEWRGQGFSVQEIKQAQEWLNTGLLDDYYFAIYLTKQGCQLSPNLNLSDLRKEYDDKSQKSQEWLDKNYSKKEIKKIYLTEPSLVGELDLGDFTYILGVTVYISPQLDETKLIFRNILKRARIIEKVVCSYDIFKILTKEEKKRTEVIDIREQKIEGALNLNDFTNLKELNYSADNKLTSLDLSNYAKLEAINCCNNKLTNLILPTNLTNLKKLNLSNNNFLGQDLSFLVKAINLEELWLGNWDKERIKQGIYNKFTGSLDYLSGMTKLKELDISNTDLNEVNINKLPRSLEEIWYSTYRRSDCELKGIIALLEKHFGKFGRCLKCLMANTRSNWCRSCMEKKWQKNIENLTGKELVEKRSNFEWIPYEQFINVEYLAEGGFGKVYKAKWKEKNKPVVLKTLHNSQNITLEFLQEIANHKLFYKDNRIVNCRGISQDQQGNHVMVMDYIKDGDLRCFLKNNQLDFQNKLNQLWKITSGLKTIHDKNLVHHDFHSGNILNKNDKTEEGNVICYITDLGLCRPVNEKDSGKIYGQPVYIAPEVLQGETYTKEADIYSFGIVAYEILTNSYPYAEISSLDDVNFALKIIDGYRPKIDELKIPQLLKDLVKKCWDVDPQNRPSIKEIVQILNKWRNKRDTQFHQQYQEIEQEYNTFSKKPYQIHPNTITTSRLIDTRKITELISSRMSSIDLSKTISTYNSYRSVELDLDIEMTTEKVKNSYQTKEYDFDIKTPTSTSEIVKRFRSLSMEETEQKETKSVKLDKVIEGQEFQTEPMEINELQTHIGQPPK